MRGEGGFNMKPVHGCSIVHFLYSYTKLNRLIYTASQSVAVERHEGITLDDVFFGSLAM
jgi:hypothetical protein